MSEGKLTSNEIQFLQEALSADCKTISIRLREGEHQFGLAKAIASFQLELYLPDVKDIIRKLYGETKTTDIQLVRKVQTILKKMEKSNIVKILPKKKPWELQKYALSSFKFQDVDKNMTVLATDEQTKQTKNMLDLALSRLQENPRSRFGSVKIKVYLVGLTLMVLASYAAIVWTVIQPVISPTVFVSAFSVAIVGGIMLGKTLSKREPRVLQ